MYNEVNKNTHAHVKIIGVGDEGTSMVHHIAKSGNVSAKFLEINSNKHMESERTRITSTLHKADVVFILASIGDETTNLIPSIAKFAKKQGAFTVAIVTKPFTFEGRKKNHIARLGIKELEDIVDLLIVIPNDQLFEMDDVNTEIVNLIKEIQQLPNQYIQRLSKPFTDAEVIIFNTTNMASFRIQSISEQYNSRKLVSS